MADENASAVRRILEAANRQDAESWASFYGVDCANHGRRVGRAGMLAVFKSLLKAFPDFHFEEVRIVAAGDIVAAELRMSGTHLGAPDLPVLGGLLTGVAPTGRHVSVENMHFYRFEGEVIADHRAVRDDLGLMQQLGLIPSNPADVSRPVK
ncbi:MAG: ester cyclase [Chloroflexota bacterium]|jgi:predicted ester cyclase